MQLKQKARMTTLLSYRIVDTAGEETTSGNGAFEQLEQLVNARISVGWSALWRSLGLVRCRSHDRWLDNGYLVRARCRGLGSRN